MPVWPKKTIGGATRAQERAACAAARAAAGEPGAAACVVRLPDGRRVSRRFRASDALDQLFAWVDSHGGGGADFGPYNLVPPPPPPPPGRARLQAWVSTWCLSNKQKLVAWVDLQGGGGGADSGPYYLVRARAL